jgi:hypothetical protein
LTLETIINHLDNVFPEIWNKVDAKDVSSILIIQIKSGNVHPNNRDPSIVGAKTQIEITAPKNEKITNPTTVLFNETAVPSDALHQWPVNAWDHSTGKWISTDVKVSGVGQKYIEKYSRIKIGGMDPNSWSSTVWANMGHYQSDPFGFLIFVREGSYSGLYSFSLPNHEILQGLLISHGSQKSVYKDGPMAGTPVAITAVINGTWDSNDIHDRVKAAEYIYAATDPNRNGERKGWIKIGKTQRKPNTRIKEYGDIFRRYDMNYIRMTSDCHKAERDLERRLKIAGVQQKGNTEWYKIDSLEFIKNCIDEVVKFLPHPEDTKIEPIIISSLGESWLEIAPNPVKNNRIINLLKKIIFWK